MPRWALPEYFEDVLPIEAERLETLRRKLLDAFRLHGYQLVIPPTIEYLDALAAGAGQDMAQSTFKLVDQISGQTLGVRADITPQVTRIDAHLLNRRGVSRLCYYGSVLHTLPRSMTASREPIQIGAELYGHAGIEADVEILRLLARALDLASVGVSRIDLGHIGLFRALTRMADIVGEAEEELFAILQAKDVPALRGFVSKVREPMRSALLNLPELYGDANVLVRAESVLPDANGVRNALSDLLHIAKHLGDLPLSFDLADLRGYNYHTGLMFAAYCGASPTAVALGGRYNEVGRAFGRGRPATGFSLDLRELAAASEATAQTGAILAPSVDDALLEVEIARLRAAGTVVMRELPGHEGCWREAGCDRRFELVDGIWHIVALQE